jgi:hypothetical protein
VCFESVIRDADRRFVGPRVGPRLGPSVDRRRRKETRCLEYPKSPQEVSSSLSLKLEFRQRLSGGFNAKSHQVLTSTSEILTLRLEVFVGPLTSGVGSRDAAATEAKGACFGVRDMGSTHAHRRCANVARQSLPLES